MTQCGLIVGGRKTVTPLRFCRNDNARWLNKQPHHERNLQKAAQGGVVVDGSKQHHKVDGNS